MNATLGKLLYGGLFVLIVPLLLGLWAAGLTGSVRLPSIHSAPAGFALAVSGLSLLVLGMLALWRKGGGLPMNAYPPQRLVSTGVYGLIPHPIYVGFVVICSGASIAMGSPGGLWVVTPAVALGCAALVLGYEGPALRQRFGNAGALSLLPYEDSSHPLPEERLRCYLLVLLPWLLLYEGVVALGVPSDGIDTYFPFERQWPVLQWTEAIYSSTYLIVALVPIIVRQKSSLRAFWVRGWLAMALVFPVYLAIPLVATPRPYAPTGFLGHLLLLERSQDSVAASFPSFHVIWAFIAASALSQGGRMRTILWYTWAAFVGMSCVTTGIHSVADVAAGFLIFLLLYHVSSVWNWILDRTESIANSWREWRLGPIRIINHGAYAGVGSFLGMLVLDSILGPGKAFLSATIFAGGIVGAALWAQWVEGSPALLRPLGFYGGMLGTIAAAFVAPLFGVSVWPALCAIVVAAPIIQAVGRLRCLVQGCCHGRRVDEGRGIRYTHPRSRVPRLTDLGGAPIYPTPLYSILWNGFIALALTHLLLLESRTSMICGIYLILSGMGRFVEEAYRGEPQTRIVFGLRFYQWIAIATVIAGAVLTTVTDAPPISPPILHSASLGVAAACGIFAWFASGVDFPESSRRFARLT